MDAPAAEPQRQLASEINAFLFGDYVVQWQMSMAERCALIQMLGAVRPRCAVEVGTANGGSLSAIARFSERVYTLDKDPTCAERLAGRFPHAEFLAGLSRQTLPPLLERLAEANAPLGFVLIDGCHKREAVRVDIENLLRFRPAACPLYVLLHDSFNPNCRAGIAEADWAGSPYVHHVELDFVPGVFHQRADLHRQMWGGFALAVLRPEPRPGELQVASRQDLLFRTIEAASVHRESASGESRGVRS